jgi:hypothetical protein
MVVGTVEEWTIFNKHNMLDRWMHSFHIHTNPFQARARCAHLRTHALTPTYTRTHPLPSTHARTHSHLRTHARTHAHPRA